ncbi:MAG: TIGR03960 family B12-binding radical SAM protein [Desulfuromonadia bacterium]
MNDDQFQDLLRTEKPARYLGGEFGSVRKEEAGCRFVLAFPDVYEVGMSHLGFRILYGVLNAIPWIAAERVYAPWPDREVQLRSRGTPLATLESHTPLDRADIIGFTLQYELSYTNILSMLELAGIPFRAADRDERHPLVIGGGPCAYNPEPLADFFDAFLVGDGEEGVIDIAQTWREWKEGGGSRDQLLHRLAAIDGVYVPSFFRVGYAPDGTIGEIIPLKEGYGRVRRRFLADLESAPFPTRPVVPFLKTIHDRVALEICRGCTRGCRFCQAGYIYRPIRERSVPTLRRLADESLRQSGADELSLLSLSTGDYSSLVPLLGALMKDHSEQRVALSLPSVRVGTLTPELVEEIRRVRKTGFTLAPEAGSERLRRVVNKGISEDELIDNARSAFQAGWRSIKLYFMIGLPTETDEDIGAIAELAHRVKRVSREVGGGGDVTVSVSSFVPKAHTPFQWEEQIPYEEILRKQEMLRELLTRKKLRFKWHDAPLSVMEGVFARGDRRLSELLLAARRRGCRFDGWSDHFSFRKWLDACDEVGIDPRWYLRARSTREILPWEMIDAGVTRSYLLAERRRADEGVPTPDCRTGSCTGCGVCDFDRVRNRVHPPFSGGEQAEGRAPVDESPCRFRIRYGRRGGMALLSHLELVNLFSRAFVRSAIPLRYSQGFHPHPKFSFASPSPVGIESQADYLDVELSRWMDRIELAERLAFSLPEGIEILSVVPIPLSARSVDATTTGIVYRVELPDTIDPPSPEDISRFLSLSSCRVTRSKGREIDLRSELVDLSVTGRQILLNVRRGKPLEYVAAITGFPPDHLTGCRITKLDLLFSHDTEDVSHGS